MKAQGQTKGRQKALQGQTDGTPRAHRGVRKKVTKKEKKYIYILPTVEYI